MPGHIKLVKGAVDPDPTEYLLPNMEMKKEDQNKPYDSKKSVWISNPKDGGYREGILEVGDIMLEDPAAKCVVAVGHEKFKMQAKNIGRVNPPKFEKCEDMVNLTYLNDASVFWNLKTRYQAKMIHTYSGLFVIVINPYKRYPIYTHRVCKIYLGKRRNEAPPHLWSIAEVAYRNMLTAKKDNALLITGESGAGKTENTKKVITYLAMVATGTGKKSEKKVSLEDQIVATNPILESYGNAKTARNDNSSRFGKFIRIHFTGSGKLAGCDIVSYLLEKSRITEQQAVERSYHIFYQLQQPFGEGICEGGLRAKCCISADPFDYIYISQGKVKVESIDDDEELMYTEDAFNVLEFSAQEKFDCYMLTAGVMSCGGIEFITKGRDDQAECEAIGPETFPGKVANTFQIDAKLMIKYFCKPRIKVGTEWVTKGQSCEQATGAVGGIARAIFDRIFKWLIIKCNDTLIDATLKKANFVAVLDIAGFEIFEYNGFEQISINFVNEKLQQFFNHHMFVTEQEEYVKEGIDWVMVDFGMDLAAAIIMFEKPMGIWAILEEESLFPKATDKSFEEKLKASLGKLPVFLKPQSKTDKNAHFAISHYAGIVSYNVTGWLEKNKDPVNDSIVEIMKSTSKCPLLVHLWEDHPGQPTSSPKGEEKKKKKKGGGKTVSSIYLVSLMELMETLHSCDPHFVRCLVPNTHKKPGDVEPPLIMHQLTCNGVLEGIRIAMRGFPNKMLYPEFKYRYACLGANELASSDDNKVAVFALMDKVEFPRERYRLGHTVIFFRAGALGMMEECRDKLVNCLIRKLQGEVYKRVLVPRYQQKADQRMLIEVAQRQFKKYMYLRDWGWFVLIQATRPMIGRLDPNEELARLEAECAAIYDDYKMKVDKKVELLAENEALGEEKKVLMAQIEKEQGNLSQYHDRQAAANAEKKVLMAQIEKEQGNLSQYHDRQAAANAEKKKLEEKLADAEKKLARQEHESKAALSTKKNLENEGIAVRKDIGDIEIIQQKLEQDKAAKDHTIKSLNDEIADQDEIINKLTKEKKHLKEVQAKCAQDLQTAKERLDHMGKIKEKLQSTLDSLENSVDKEKKSRSNVEKERRKVQGELKMAQETVADIERDNKEIEAAILRKDNEMCSLSSALDDEQSLVQKIQRGIREQQSHVEDLEAELEAERQARAKAERQRSDLAREMDSLGDRLNEASGATSAQVELNKKREAEVNKLRKDLEEANIQHESTLVSLKKKHADSIAEMNEQCEQLNKMKAKVTKDVSHILNEINECKAATDEVNRSKASADKTHRTLSNNLADLAKKCDTAALHLSDFDREKRRLASENADLLREVQELSANASLMLKTKASLVSALDEAKANADQEGKDRVALLGKFRNLEHSAGGLRENLDEEISQKENLARQLEKAVNDGEMWRQKYEKEGVARAEELEMAKMKLSARLSENHSTIDQLNLKLSQLEKAKHKLSDDVTVMAQQLDQAQLMNSAMEKKAQQFDRIVGEWKCKVDGLAMDLDNAQKETRNTSSDLFKVKNAYDEAVLQLDEVRRENKMLSNEIKDIMDQISEGGRSIHEIDKIRKRLEAEKMELEAALSEAEGTLEQEENKVLRASLELAQVKQEIERRIAQKEDEFVSTKKNFAKAIEGMQTAVENETKAKQEANRMRKKLEADVVELGIALEHANAANAETNRNIKLIQENIRNMQKKYEEESHAKAVAQDNLIAADRKANANQNALEEVRTLLEQADRNRRLVEAELADTNECLSDQTCQNQAIQGAKMKCEHEMSNMSHDLDEMASEAALSEEKAQRSMIDAARLADELRAEQDQAMDLDRDRKLLEAQVKDAANRVDEAEQNALKGGKKAIAKMETRIRELESEIDAENRRQADAQKNLRKSERHIKELTYQQDEDRKNHERMQSLIDQLQGKIKSYKKQIEEAEEIAALNLSKFRTVQANLLGIAEETEAKEHAVARARARSASIQPQ